MLTSSSQLRENSAEPSKSALNTDVSRDSAELWQVGVNDGELESLLGLLHVGKLLGLLKFDEKLETLLEQRRLDRLLGLRELGEEFKLGDCVEFEMGDSA